MIQYIHIGYPKSASTWLQRTFFPAFPERINLLYKSLTKPILYNDLDYSRQAVLNMAKPLVRAAMTNVYSDEILSGWTEKANFSRTCDRLKELFPDAKVLIVLRNQNDFLLSYYKFYISRGYGFSEHRFLNRYCHGENIYRFLEYEHLLGYCKQLFDEVHVELFERLILEHKMRDLLGFFGLEDEPMDPAALTAKSVNASPGTAQAIALSRYVNRHFGTYAQLFDNYNCMTRWNTKIRPAFERTLTALSLARKYTFKEKHVEQIQERFRESNARLQAHFDYDIAPYGYVK
ncbi:MAG: sulfotransferase domain-containing protein [Desulfovibrionaceae bacterium]